MAVRDRVALWVVTIGAIGAIIGWRVAGPWPAMAVGVLAVLAACAAYRIEAPRVDLDRLPLDDEADRRTAATATGGGDPMDQ